MLLLALYFIVLIRIHVHCTSLTRPYVEYSVTLPHLSIVFRLLIATCFKFSNYFMSFFKWNQHSFIFNMDFFKCPISNMCRIIAKINILVPKLIAQHYNLSWRDLWMQWTLVITNSLGPVKLLCYTCIKILLYPGCKNNKIQRNVELRTKNITLLYRNLLYQCSL